MKVYLVAFIAAVVVALSSLLMVGEMLRPSTSDNESYLAAIIDKHRRADTTPSPRVLLVGGSNLAFGVDTAYLEASWGCPVVNLGLHAGLGLDFIMGEALTTARSGDTVVFVPEYGLLMRNGQPTQVDLIRRANDYFPESTAYTIPNPIDAALFYLNRSRRRALQAVEARLRHVPEINEQPAEGSAETVYARSSFNAYGDVVAHLARETQGPAVERPTQLTMDARAIAANVARFVSKLEQRNVSLILTFPPHPDTWFAVNRTEIEEVVTELTASGVRIEGQPTDFIFPEAAFFDTAYHLGSWARSVRTRRLAELLVLHVCR